MGNEVGGNLASKIGRKTETRHSGGVMRVPNKAELREEIRGRLAPMSEGGRAEASGQIQNHLLERPEWDAAGVVALFLSLPDEPQTRGILQAAWAAGKRVALPKIDIREGLTWWQMVAGPVPESSTLWEPSPEKSVRIPVTEIDGFLVPGRAFTAGGARLGRGGGHYDRALGQRRRGSWVAGFFFAAQEMEFLPEEPHDVKLPAVITEKGWRDTR